MTGNGGVGVRKDTRIDVATAERKRENSGGRGPRRWVLTAGRRKE
jgi:hypothetical protein